MRGIVLAAASALAISAAAPAIAADYFVNQSTVTQAVTGTITTDGTLGALAANNITGFSLTFTSGASTQTVTSSSGAPFDIAGSAFTATSQGLFFNYSAAGHNGFYFSNSTFTTFFCSNTNTFDCLSNTVPSLTLSVNGTISAVARTGNQLIATAVNGAVPEPATWSLMLVGFAMVGAGLRSRRRSTTVTYA